MQAVLEHLESIFHVQSPEEFSAIVESGKYTFKAGAHHSPKNGLKSAFLSCAAGRAMNGSDQAMNGSEQFEDMDDADENC